MSEWLDEIAWNADGLVPVVTQEVGSNTVLMMAWMNREALILTVQEGRAVYWSRSRAKLWRKGEESGHVQLLKDLRLDCDRDVLLVSVEQLGGVACHTGRHNCFYRKLVDGKWVEEQTVIRDPESMYGLSVRSKS
jgi:phosphoribosyl-AMP cyclohydrolase